MLTNIDRSWIYKQCTNLCTLPSLLSYTIALHDNFHIDNQNSYIQIQAAWTRLFILFFSIT